MFDVWICRHCVLRDIYMFEPIKIWTWKQNSSMIMFCLPVILVYVCYNAFLISYDTLLCFLWAFCFLLWHFVSLLWYTYGFLWVFWGFSILLFLVLRDSLRFSLNFCFVCYDTFYAFLWYCFVFAMILFSIAANTSLGMTTVLDELFKVNLNINKLVGSISLS